MTIPEFAMVISDWLAPSDIALLKKSTQSSIALMKAQKNKIAGMAFATRLSIGTRRRRQMVIVCSYPASLRAGRATGFVRSISGIVVGSTHDHVW